MEFVKKVFPLWMADQDGLVVEAAVILHSSTLAVCMWKAGVTHVPQGQRSPEIQIKYKKKI